MDARLLMESPRDRMIEAAIRGMRESGLAGAGINQVIAASGAPKGSLYHYFPGGKLQLAQEALQHYGFERGAELAKAMAGPGPAGDKVRRLFARAAKAMAREDYAAGCAVAGVSLDLQPESQPLAPICAALLDNWAAVVATALVELPPERRPAWGRVVMATFEGALVQARAARSGQPLVEAGELLGQALAAAAASPI